MLLNIEQFEIAASEAPNYTDVDAFVSDLYISLFPEMGEELDMEAVEHLRSLHYVMTAPIKDIAARGGIRMKQLSKMLIIPFGTMVNRANGVTTCPPSVRVYMGVMLGLLSPATYKKLLPKEKPMQIKAKKMVPGLIVNGWELLRTSNTRHVSEGGRKSAVWVCKNTETGDIQEFPYHKIQWWMKREGK